MLAIHRYIMSTFFLFVCSDIYIYAIVSGRLNRSNYRSVKYWNHKRWKCAQPGMIPFNVSCNDPQPPDIHIYKLHTSNVLVCAWTRCNTITLIFFHLSIIEWFFPHSVHLYVFFAQFFLSKLVSCHLPPDVV